MRFPACLLLATRAASLLALCAGLAAIAPAQTFIDEVRVKLIEPSGGKVRPLEEAILKVEVYGTLRSKDGSEQKGLLPLDAAYLAFEKKNTGWVSKPFQCPDFSQTDYVRERTGGWRDILGTVQNFTLKSCHLYTAPERSGKYRIQASKDGVAGDIYIEVSNDAPSIRKRETVSFGEEPRSADPYLPLVEHYAPFIAQETWFNSKADSIARFDYDGDFRGDNNWENLDKGSSQAYVYYAVMETGTHWFLHYNFFHPRDYSDTCLVGSCHENDNEGLILAVRKDGARFGKLEVMETLAHNLLFSYISDLRIEERAQEINGEIAYNAGSHPIVFIEAGGHGVASATDRKLSKYDHVVMQWLPGTTGITYSYKGQAEYPGHVGADNVGYALLPIYEHWWLRAISSAGQTDRIFADYFPYAPVGNRPSTTAHTIAGAFLGVEKSPNKAKPFWGWHDDRTLKAGILARGQWALDPAYSFTRNLRFPDELPVSLDYTFNPYLGIGSVAGATMSTSSPMATPATPAQGQGSTSPSLDGFAGEFSKPNDGWSQPPANSAPQQKPQGWGTPQPTEPTQPKPDALPPGWGPPIAYQGKPEDHPTVKFLQDVIRVDTSNPPGKEGELAQMLAPRLTQLGFTVEIIPTPEPGKAHLIARLKGDGSKRPVLLAAHADVVGVEREKWTLEPFEGVIKDGYVYGRGAIDFKGGLAVFARSVMMLAENKVPLSRDVILLVEADEEGGKYNTTWLAQNHWDKIDCEFSLNEGGWILKDDEGTVDYVSISTADKSSIWLEITGKGTSTHSSMPLRDNAIFRLSRAMAKLSEYETKPFLIPSTRRFFETLAKVSDSPMREHYAAIAGSNDPARIAVADAAISERSPLFHALIRNTIAPVLLDGGFRSNVIPGDAKAVVNFRIIPGTDPEEVRREIAKVVEGEGVDVAIWNPSFLSEDEQRAARQKILALTPSTENTDLFRSLEARAHEVYPTAEVTPYLFQAGTDSVAWRARGIPVYGIYPYPISDADLMRMHGNDERVPVESLISGTQLIYNVLLDVAAKR